MSADVLFTGGPVFTGVGLPLEGMAVSVVDGRISAVVPEAETETLAGPGTRRIDLNGALLAPGFQDAHVHPVGGGVELLQCNLTEAENAEQALAAIAAYAAANPEESWIVGAGWSMDHYPGGTPTRQLLDAIVPERPVFLMNRDHHGAWANTAAIRLAGLDASTPDPEDGRIEREADGHPAGTFHEGAAELFAEVKPEVSPDLVYRGLLRAQEEMLSLGITGWQDAIVGSANAPVPDGTAAYLRAIDEGTLKVHVIGAQWWERGVGLEQIEGILARRDERASSGSAGRFELGSVKMMVDGVAENYTAAMLEPYRDASGHDTCNHGISFIAPEIMREAVTRLDAAGMQVHFHALGDRAVRDALDAVGAARAENGPRDNRHHLAHLQVVAEADAPRSAEVDAVANLQALWATHEDQLDTLTLPFMQDGAERRQYPFGDLVRGGAKLAAGSDWPVSSADPLAAIAVAVNRAVPGYDAPPLGGEHQRLDLATALAAYTSGSAYVNHRDHDTGHVREGYLANLVIIEPNPFEVPSDELFGTAVTSTWVEGEEVYRAGRVPPRTDSM
ncbi:amidohydrolase [Leucobacter soli]|uniref:amidohydrolase n=1 Tax=Leucobacter soli TaxID=2812850 RepID=UPI003613CCA4